jgi:hypothetical protein
MCRRALFSLLVVALLACALPSPSPAQEPYPRDNYGGQVMPLDRILPNVRAGRPGRFYDAEGPFPDGYGGYHYRIKWLTPQGRVIWLDADARTGRVMGQARGDWRAQGPPPAFGGGARTGPGYMGPPGGFRGGPGGPGGGFGRPGGRGPGGGGWHGGGRGHGGR